MKLNIMIAAVALTSAALLSSCQQDDSPSDPTQTTISANRAVQIDPSLELGGDVTYLWSVESAASDLYSLANTTSQKPTFIAAKSGMYKLKCTARKEGQSHIRHIDIVVVQPEKTQSPYIAKVYDYMPAVGQFVNELPQFATNDTKNDMIAKVEKYLVGQKNGSLVSLGGYGGYVVFGFDHTIVNVSGQRDFRIMGNAFYSDANPRPDAPRGGSCEPGIVMVSYDANQNGQADDPWYEIAGSEYNKPTTIKNYQITYNRPQTENPVNANQYVLWQDNQSNEGYIAKNNYHTQSYYPQWISDMKISFNGTLLAPNGVDESGEGNYWVLYAYGYGYADNALNTEDDSAIDISWAVNAQGQKVELVGIDFVKVYTGVNQQCGWIGENSTEIAGAYDLHLENENIPTVK